MEAYVDEYINKLIELYFGYIKKAVKEDKFTTEDGTVKYDNKDLEVTKIKYEMNSNDQFEFANSIYESMKNDNEFKELDMLTSSLQLKSQDLINGNVELPAYRLFE